MSDDGYMQSKVQAVSHRKAPPNIVDWLSQQETGSADARSIVAKLYNACIEQLAGAWKRIQSNSAWSQSEKYHLKESFGRFHLWGIGLPLDTLEDAETHIEEIRKLLLELLCNVSELLTSDTLGALPRLLHGTEETSVLGQYTAAARDILAKGNDEDESLTPISAIVIKKSTAIPSRTSWLDSFDFHLDCLQDLGSTIERLESVNESLPQHIAGAMAAHTLPSTVSSGSGPGLENAYSYFVLQVRDKFPLSSEGLAERLGMANWQRFLRLRSGNPRAEETEFVRPTVPARSKFYDSALGSSLGAPSGPASSVVSHLSFLSSQADEETLHFRVPATPLGVGQGKEFRCFICGQPQILKNRVAWKIHVFADLMAYICSFEGCRRNKEPFSRRSDWADHELREHFRDRLWRCSFCSHSETRADLYQDHLQQTHRFTSTDKELLQRISGDVVTTLKSVTEISCPLCRKTGWNSHRSYFAHMGRHMEEIALAALAREVDDEDEGSDGSQTESYTNSEFSCEEVARSMVRQKKNAEPKIVELKCSDRMCDKIFSRKCDLAKHEKTHCRPFKCLDEDCRYHEQGFPTERERDRHINDKHPANPRYYNCIYCPFKTKRGSNCKQHMEKKHGWQYDRVEENANTVRTPEQTPLTPLTPSMEYSPSVPSPALSTMGWEILDESATFGSGPGSTMVTTLDQPMHGFNPASTSNAKERESNHGDEANSCGICAKADIPKRHAQTCFGTQCRTPETVYHLDCIGQEKQRDDWLCKECFAREIKRVLAPSISKDANEDANEEEQEDKAASGEERKSEDEERSGITIKSELPAVSKPNLDEEQPSGISPRPKARENAKETLCRNVVIYGKCRFEDKGCAFNHDTTKANGVQPMEITWDVPTRPERDSGDGEQYGHYGQDGTPTGSGQGNPKRKQVITKTGCMTCRRRKKICDEGQPQCNNCVRGGFQCVPRTMTGCLICRQRKKKCDEGQPQCNNCVRGGFQCEGYNTRGTPTPHADISNFENTARMGLNIEQQQSRTHSSTNDDSEK